MLKHFNEIQDPKMIGVNAELMQMLDDAREIAEVPFIITSGLRTPEHNAEIGGVRDSAHLKGLAVDIACNDRHTRFKIIKGLIIAGFTRILWGKGHVHADIDPTKAQEIMDQE